MAPLRTRTSPPPRAAGPWGGAARAAAPAGAPGPGANEALAAALAQGDGGAASGISVSGQGVTVSEPDIATLALGVSTLADSARQARGPAAVSMTALIESLTANGVAEKDYHTSQFSIEPHID